MAHPHAKEAKAGHAKKLAGFGGKSKGHEFNDTSTYDGVPPINTDKQRGLAPLNTEPSLSPKTAGAIMRSHGGKAKHRLDRKPRAKGGRFEGSAKDEREDKKLSKEHHMSMKKWEGSEADKRYDRAHGGRTGKGKTQVNVIVAPHGGGQGAPTPVPVPHPVPVGPPPAPPPMMGGMPPGGMPMGGPGPMPPGLMRKKGGRVNKIDGLEGSSKGKGGGPEGDSFGKGGDGENPQPEIREKFGSAGGLGRLEKRNRQEKADSKYRSRENY